MVTHFSGATLRGLLESGGFDVVGEASDGQTVAAMARQTGAEVILLDMEMPRQNAIGILKELSIDKTPVRTLLLATSVEREEVVRALKLGACGVIPQDATPQHLFDSIRCVMAGQYWVGRDSVSDLVKALREDSAAGERFRPRQYGLTPREMEIVALIVAGYSNPDIAQRFSISEQTVKHHISHIFDKVGVSNRLELALFAVNRQLTGPAS